MNRLMIIGVILLGSACGKDDGTFEPLKYLGGGGSEDQQLPSLPPEHEKNLNLAFEYDLSVNSYASCDALQEDVRNQLVLKRQNDQARTNYYDALYKRNSGDGSGSVQPAAMEDSAVSADSSGDNDEESFTNNQEKGVDEADVVKIGTHSIFIVKKEHIEVVDRDSLEGVGSLALGGSENVKLFADGERLTVVKVISTKNKSCHQVSQVPYSDCGYIDDLMLSSMEYDECHSTGGVDEEISDFESCFEWEEKSTEVVTYSAQKGGAPAQLNSVAVAGEYKEARFVAGKVVLVVPDQLELMAIDASQLTEKCGTSHNCFQQYYSQKNYNRYSSYYLDSWGNQQVTIDEIPANPIKLTSDATVSGIECTSIQKPQIHDMDFRMTKLISIDTRNLETPPIKVGMIGGGDYVYMTTKSIYIAKQGLSWTPWHPPKEGDDWYGYGYGDWDKLVVAKAIFLQESGQIAVSAIGVVEGRPRDQWAFKELQNGEALAVATTTWGKLGDGNEADYTQHNHLWLMQQDEQSLAVRSAINNFAPNEDIRAIRYIGDTAYVVTYRKTDPLFAFDLSDVAAPALLGELKIPGFSMYLHPAGEGRMIGVGYAADEQETFSWFQGIQVSLYDVSNPLSMSRLSNTVIGHRGSYSDVTGDHKAFFMDPATGLFAVPVVEKIGGGEGSGGQQGESVGFTGAIVYQHSGNEIIEKSRITHQELIPAVCKSNRDWHWWSDARQSLDINRVYQVDGRLISVSRFGIKAHSLEDPSVVLAQSVFSNNDSSCATGGWGNW